MTRKVLAVVLFILTCVVMTITSCSKDPEEMIEGEWQIVKSTAVMGAYTYDNTEEVGHLEYHFLEDGKLELVGDNVNDDSATWNYADEKLTVTIKGEAMCYEVDNLERHDMTLRYETIEDDVKYSLILDMEKI